MTGDEQLLIRGARADDARDVWRWRNDPASRSASHSSELLAWPDHAGWYERALVDPAKMLLIGEVDREKVGLVRFDTLETGERLIGIIVAPAWRGRGVGPRLLSAALDQLHGCAFLAEVRQDNAASLRLFDRLGFERRGVEGEFVVFQRAEAA